MTRTEQLLNGMPLRWLKAVQRFTGIARWYEANAAHDNECVVRTTIWKILMAADPQEHFRYFICKEQTFS